MQYRYGSFNNGSGICNFTATNARTGKKGRPTIQYLAQHLPGGKSVRVVPPDHVKGQPLRHKDATARAMAFLRRWSEEFRYPFVVQW